ncbi:hypothetical protein INT45_003074 [Circinella minor]|uniref:HMG box domain-containing protein n=1 Tax=Circinella minor TaxID=1195481 RepID=A0A8H7RX37_9FUNG|nr:hypothetical protein INT45_003074 [Circinella minor]
MNDASIINHERRMIIQTIAQDAENMACSIHNLANIIKDLKRKGVSELTEEKKKKKITLMDLEEPEKPQGAYDFFVSENYAAIQNRFPNNDYNKNTKILSDLWKKIPTKERKKYENLAELDKKQYDINCLKFKEGHETHRYNSRKDGVTGINKKLQRKQQTKTSGSLNSRTIIEKKGDNDKNISKLASAESLVFAVPETEEQVHKEQEKTESTIVTLATTTEEQASPATSSVSSLVSYSNLPVFHDDLIDELDSETSSNKELSAAIISSIPEIVVRKSTKNKNNRSGALVVPTIAKNNNPTRKHQQQMGNDKYYDNEKKKRKLSKH